MAIDQGTMKEIQRKAESGVALDKPTAEKQKAYDTFLKQMTSTVTQKAKQGVSLDAPNAHKQSIYDAALKNLTSKDPAYYNDEQVMNRFQSDSDVRVKAIEELLKGQADASFESQDSILQATRDQKIAELKKALEDAVEAGEISVREAEAQFEENKGVIEKKAYQDAERTNIAANSLGIQNSMQMVGMQAGDNARANSLISENMTERDRRVADIKTRIQALTNKSSIDMAFANAEYGYASAGAKGQIDAALLGNMANLQGQQLQSEQQLSQALATLGIQNRNQLAQLAKQHGYDLEKMSIEQLNRIALEELGHKNNLDLQNNQQEWQSGENDLNRGHDFDMQENQFGFQSEQNDLDRQHQWDTLLKNIEHDGNMFTNEVNEKIRQEGYALNLEYMSLTEPNSKAYQIRAAQRTDAINMAMAEGIASSMSELLSADIIRRFGDGNLTAQDILDIAKDPTKAAQFEQAVQTSPSVKPESKNWFKGVWESISNGIKGWETGLANLTP